MKTLHMYLPLLAFFGACAAPAPESRPAHLSGDELGAVLRCVQEVHGPPSDRWKLPEIIGSRISHDFNGDGLEEIVVFFTDDGLGDLDIDDLGHLRGGVVTCGFLMATRVEGRLWPVFYYFDEYRVTLTYKRVLAVTGLVAEGGKGGAQTVWGWRAGVPDLPDRWDAFWRAEDGTPHIQARFLASYGK